MKGTFQYTCIKCIVYVCMQNKLVNKDKKKQMVQNTYLIYKATIVENDDVE